MKFHYITEHSGKLIAKTIDAENVIEAEQILDKHYHKVHIVSPCSYTIWLSKVEGLT